jgi:hypothetical protein
MAPGTARMIKRYTLTLNLQKLIRFRFLRVRSS